MELRSLVCASALVCVFASVAACGPAGCPATQPSGPCDRSVPTCAYSNPDANHTLGAGESFCSCNGAPDGGSPVWTCASGF